VNGFDLCYYSGYGGYDRANREQLSRSDIPHSGLRHCTLKS
jgi:hypothetical protein